MRGLLGVIWGDVVGRAGGRLGDGLLHDAESEPKRLKRRVGAQRWAQGAPTGRVE